MLKQQTLKGSFSLNGKGLHTGVKLTVTFNPAPEHYGYKIQRIDLDDQPILDAVAENVVDTTRGTVLAKNVLQVMIIIWKKKPMRHLSPVMRSRITVPVKL